MLKVRVTNEATLDLQKIGRYTEKTWSIAQRNIYLKEIDERFQWLRENHSLGKKRDEIKGGYLSYHEGRHVIFYIITDTTVDIISVLHESMDFRRHL